MGNKFGRDNEQTRTKSRIFHPINNPVTTSITIPSICDTTSYHLTVKKSTSNTSSEAFSWNQMQALYLQQEFLSTDHLTIPVLKYASVVLEVMKRILGEVCADLENGTIKMPETMVERFFLALGIESGEIKQNLSATAVHPQIKKFIVHFVTTIFMHDTILDHFRQRKVELALDLIKQVAVSHALIGVTPTDFRMMDWFIIQYLIKNKISSDENINNLTIYLNTVSNYVEKFYETQSVRHTKLKKLTSDDTDHRNNKARENYRLMKKWKKQIEIFKDQERYVEGLLAEQEELRKSQINRSVDTLTLKEKDWIMKHFMSRRRTSNKKGRKPSSQSSNNSAAIRSVEVGPPAGANIPKSSGRRASHTHRPEHTNENVQSDKPRLSIAPPSDKPRLSVAQPSDKPRLSVAQPSDKPRLSVAPTSDKPRLSIAPTTDKPRPSIVPKEHQRLNSIFIP